MNKQNKKIAQEKRRIEREKAEKKADHLTDDGGQRGARHPLLQTENENRV